MNRKFVLFILLNFAFGLLFTVWGKNFEEEEEDVDIKYDRIKTPKPGTETNTDTQTREALKLDGFSESELKSIVENSENHTFQAEVDRMMTLIINSLYKNKDIFLRELISNASDALDKLRLLSLTDSTVMEDADEFSIKVKVVPEDKTLRVMDTGIGMTKADMLTNLGTVAKSGTSDFISRLGKAETETETSDLIGQFGVGFYSAFLVSEKVTVVSKHGDDDQYIWESDSKTFSIVKDPRGNTMKRGTEIILHLKPEAEHYLQNTNLEDLIRRYSQFINFPIYLLSTKTVMVDETTAKAGEEASTTETPVDKDEQDNDGEDKAASDEDATVEDEGEAKKVSKEVPDWKRMNELKPVWLRKKSNVTDKEYNDLYKALSNDQTPPLAKIHFMAEGEVTFRSILYIPAVAPYDMHRNMHNLKEKIRLYVRRVFITDDFSDMMPYFFNFIRGIVDSDDLPLNVSREMLQQSKLLKLIRKKMLRKVIDMIRKLNDDELVVFWKEYGTNIKLGVVDDSANRNRLANLLRFRSSHNSTIYTTLSEYVERMKEKQKNIFFTAGDNLESVMRAPQSERLVKKGYEVLYCIDPIDEYALNAIPAFDGKKFQNTAKEGLEDTIEVSEKTKERKAAEAESFKPLLEHLQTGPLKDVIEKATLSDMLMDSPCAVASSTYGVSGNMEKIMKTQSYKKGVDVNPMNNAKRILQLNPRHPLIKELKARVNDERKEDPVTTNMIKLMYEGAALRSGYDIQDSISFSERLERLMRATVGIPLDEKVEEIEEDEEVESKTADDDSSDAAGDNKVKDAESKNTEDEIMDGADDDETKEEL